MHRRFHWWIMVAVLVPGLTRSTDSHANGAPVVAVFDIELARVRLKRGVKEALLDTLTAELATGGAFQIVPRDQIARRLRKQRLGSYKRCYARSCQIAVGKQLAANKTLSFRIARLGRQCLVTLKLWDLRKATTERASQALGGCGERHLYLLVKSAAANLARRRPKPAEPGAGVVAPAPGIARAVVLDSNARRRAQKARGLLWQPLPGATFRMGSDRSGAFKGDPDEAPTRRHVRRYFLTQTEITVAQYRRCITAGGCSQPDTGPRCSYSKTGADNLPVNCVDWHQARAFCTWAGGRLPSEAEWELAARSAKGWRYPWGNQRATCRRAVMRDGGRDGCGNRGVAPVCSRAAGSSAQALCDLAGNVWEWVEDCYVRAYDEAPSTGQAGSGCQRVNRGGGWDSSWRSLRAAARAKLPASSREPDLGFRCAK